VLLAFRHELDDLAARGLEFNFDVVSVDVVSVDVDLDFDFDDDHAAGPRPAN
jgi:hypothetical protein